MHYDYVALPDRKPLKWPGGHRVAMIFTLNLEYWEFLRDGAEPFYPGGPASIPHMLPGNVADYANWTWREYGQRVGIWRLIDVFDRAGVPATCTMNAMTGIERRRIIDAVNERKWEILAHNYVQNDPLSSYAHAPNEEKQIIRKTLDVYEQTVGRPARGWLSSSLRCTPNTPGFLKEFGLLFHSDFLNDDQPYLIHTDHGPLVCVPYSNDVNDFAIFARAGMSTSDGAELLREQFDQLYLEGADSGRIMNFGIHPHVTGQPYRVRALREFIDYIKDMEGVWFPTREEIALWYLDNHESHIAKA